MATILARIPQPDPHPDIIAGEYASDEGMFDDVRLFFAQLRQRHERLPDELTIDVTDALNAPVKPEPLDWYCHQTGNDYVIELELYEIRRHGSRLVATYMVEVDCG